MPTLLEVGKKLGSLTAAYAPKKTGNLRKQLRAANTGRSTLGGRNSAQAEKELIANLQNKTYSFEFDVIVGPPGAEYGQWWNTPPKVSSPQRKKLSKRKEFNFFDQAYQSPEFQQYLDLYIDNLTEKIAEGVGKLIDKELK